MPAGAEDASSPPRRVPSWVAAALLGATVLAVAAVAVDEVLSPDTARYRIPSESMLPTLEVGEIVEVNRDAYDDDEPERGDIVAYYPPRGAEFMTCGVRHGASQPCPRPRGPRQDDTKFIHRIVAVPGDRISIQDGRTYIGGRRQDEPYARASTVCMVCNLGKEALVPPGHYFVMGDNRAQSADSRGWGPIRKEWIVGRVDG